MEINAALLKKYYQGLCTPEEKATVEAWQVSMETGSGDALDLTEQAALETEMWQHLQQTIPAKLEDLQPAAHRPSPVKNLIRYGIAASIMLMICAGGFFLLHKKTVIGQATPIAYQTISTHGAEKKQIELEDGTRIVLNSESSLRYPVHFTDTSRVVYLDGEAYFQVAKDHTRPFSILTSATRTQVLGTVFNLKAYNGEPATLGVEEGRVRFGGLTDHGSHQIFTRGQYGVFSSSGTLFKTTGNADTVAPWKDNRLHFTNESLAQIIAVLQRWYAVQIKVADSKLLEQQFTGEFENPSIGFLLDRLGFVMKFKYKINGSVVQIVSNP